MSLPSPRTARPTAREKLLAAAAERFYADGIAATGIDAITAQAGVARMSLYNNFSSKTQLVEEYLRERHEEWLDLYARRRDAADDAPGRVLAVFDAYLDHALAAHDHGFRGCGLLNAAAELAGDSPGRAAVREHKEQVEQILRDELASMTDAAAAADLAEHFSFLLEGAMARAGLECAPARLEHARDIAQRMVSAL